MNKDNTPKTTDFGYTQVAWDEKQVRVGEVFHSVADRYDLMNDLMSLGVHRLWKRFALSCAQVRAGEWVLDVAGGTGDLSQRLAKLTDHVVMLDINAAMLQVGRDRLLDAGLIDRVSVVQGNAEILPLAANQFDCIIIGFGLRNVTDKNQALKSMFRVLKPGGRLIILEFSKPQNQLLQTLYDTYSFTILPKLGEFVAQDAKSYQYLAESIRMHPNQAMLSQTMTRAGFEDCRYYNLTGGIVAIHKAYKY